MKKSKSVTWLSWILMIGFLFFTVVLQLKYSGLIANNTNEEIYWERARFFLGQDGASWYDGASVCSLGYSLILMPLCALIDSSYAAYKAAILLNGFFLCLAYFTIVQTAKKFFPKKNEKELMLFCLFSILCPAIALNRFYTGPETIVFFLVCILIYLLTLLKEDSSLAKLTGVAVCLVLISFFQITMLGIVMMTILLLFIMVRRGEIEERKFLIFMIIFIAGFVGSNIIERIFLHFLSFRKDYIASSSLKVVFELILNGIKEQSVSGLLVYLLGKIFSLSVSSFLLLGAGIYYFVHRIFLVERRGRRSVSLQISDIMVFGLFTGQLLFSAMYGMGCSLESELFAFSGSELLVPFLILYGFYQISESDKWEKDLTGFLLILSVVALLFVRYVQTQGMETVSKINSGVFSVLQNGTREVDEMIYFASLIALVGCIFVFIAVRFMVKCKKNIGVIKVCGIIGILIIFLSTDALIFRNTACVTFKNGMENVSPLASVVVGLDADTEYYYLCGGKSDGEVTVLQSLLPEHKIKVIENSDEERAVFFEKCKKSEKEIVIFTGVKGDFIDVTISEEMEQFRLLYMTSKHSVWALRGSNTCSIIESNVSARIESPKWEKEKDKISTVSTSLAPGTYRMELYFSCKNSESDSALKVSAINGNSTLAKKTVKDIVLDENKSGSIVLEFSTKEILNSFKLEVESEFLADIEIKEWYYWKTSSAYTVGINGNNTVQNVCKEILKIEEYCEDKGRIAYIADKMIERDDLSTRCFETALPGYSVPVISKDEIKKIQAEYLIGVTSSHSYFSSMDEYSIICRTAYYTVLARNDSEQYQKYLENGGKVYSEAYQLMMEAFLKSNQDLSEPIVLEAGTYKYHFIINAGENQWNSEDKVLGTVCLYDKDKLVTQKQITAGDLMDSSTEVSVEFSLPKKSKELYFEFITDEKNSVEIIPRSIELASEKYQFGKEEINFERLFQMIDILGLNQVLVVLDSDEIEDGLISVDYLQQNIPQCDTKVVSYEEVEQLNGDYLLVTYGCSKQYLELLDDFQIVEQLGQYTVFVKSNGEILQNALASGMQIKNSGNKVTLNSLRIASGCNDGEDLILPKASYEITVALSASELKLNDVIEINLLSEKSEETVEQEIEELVESGLSYEEAIQSTEEWEECGNTSCEAYLFEETDKVFVTIKTNKELSFNNLSVEVYSWSGAAVKGEIVWVELI